MRVFISCVSDEFRSYRGKLREELTARELEITIQEKLQDGGHTLLQLLDDYIKRCQAVIHLIGDGVGQLAKPEEVRGLLNAHPDLSTKVPALAAWLDPDACPFSYTQWEAFLAIYHGVPCYIYRAAADSEREPDFAATPADSAAQEAHVERLRALGKFRAWESFSDPMRLANRFLKCLIEQDGGRAPSRIDPAYQYRWPEVAKLPPHKLADCTEEMALFRALISGQSPAPVLLIRGPSAMGKTTLLKQFAKLARQQAGLRVAVGDFKHGAALGEVLEFARAALPDQCFPAFDAEWSGARREEVLGAAFLDDLRYCPDPVLLMLDTYEQATAENQRWVETRLLPRCCRHDGLRLLIAGQRVPEAGGVTAPPTERRELLHPRPEDWADYYHRVLGGKPLPADHFNTLWVVLDGLPSAMCAALAKLCQAA